MKRLKFKTRFNGFENAVKMIPQKYRIDGSRYEITDGVETFRIEWKGSPFDGRAVLYDNITGSYQKNLGLSDLSVKNVDRVVEENHSLKAFVGNVSLKNRISFWKVFAILVLLTGFISFLIIINREALSRNSFSENSNNRDRQEKSESQINSVQINDYTEIKERIVSTLNRYYQINSAAQCNELEEFFVPIVDNYFSKSSISRSEIVEECMSYHNRWPYQQINLNEPTISVSIHENGDYFVTYDLFYKVKRNIESDWKDFYLTINIIFTPDLKIRSILEYSKPG